MRHTLTHKKAPSFQPSTRVLPVTRHNPQSYQHTCGQTPNRVAEAKLNLAAKSLAVTAALLCVPLLPPFRDRLPQAYRRSGPHAALIALVAAGVASRTSHGHTLGVNTLGVNRDEPQASDQLGNKESVVNAVEGTATKIRDAFSSSRAEWGAADPATEVSEPSTYSYSFKQSRRVQVDTRDASPEKSAGTYQEKGKEVRTETMEMQDEALTIVTAKELTKKLVSVPGYILKELLLPVAEIGSVLWYDIKVGLLDIIGGKDRYFVSDKEVVKDRRAGCEDVAVDEYLDDTNAPDMDELTVEEQQILEMQRATEQAVEGIGETAKTVTGKMRRLLATFF